MSAMMLALPAGRSPLVRGGIAVIQLAASVKRLFTRERASVAARHESPPVRSIRFGVSSERGRRPPS